MPSSQPPVPAERQLTIRQSIQRELELGWATALEISGLVGIPEKEVAHHLEHLAQSLRRGPRRLAIEPAECLSCGFVFESRKRLTKPSSCPECRASCIAPPRYRISTPSENANSTRDDSTGW